MQWMLAGPAEAFDAGRPGEAPEDGGGAGRLWPPRGPYISLRVHYALRLVKLHGVLG